MLYYKYLFEIYDTIIRKEFSLFHEITDTKYYDICICTSVIFLPEF